METVVDLSICNEYGKRNWHSKSVKQKCSDEVYSEDARKLNPCMPTNCNYDIINGIQVRGMPDEVTGDGVLLWLHPPRAESLHDYSTSTKLNGSILKKNYHNVFINICFASKSGELLLSTEKNSTEMERKKIVSLISFDVDQTCSLQHGGELVTVVDFIVDDDLFQKCKTKRDIYSFCNDLVEYFNVSSVPLPSISSIQHDHVLYHVICNMTPKPADPQINDNSTFNYGCYISESPKKSERQRKTGKKNKRDSIVSGKEKKSRFGSHSMVFNQTKILGSKNYMASFMHAKIKEISNNIETADSNFKSKKIKIDFGNTNISRELCIDVCNNVIFIAMNAVFDVALQIPLLCKVHFCNVFNIPYTVEKSFIEFNLMMDLSDKVRKMLPSSSSIDSGIGHENNFEHSITKISCEKYHLNTVLESVLPIKENVSGLVFCPTFSIKQTLSQIAVLINCGDGIQQETLQVCQVSSLLMMISFTNCGSSATPLKYCLKVASCNVDHTHPENNNLENQFRIQSPYKFINPTSEKYELLKQVHVSSGELMVLFDKGSSKDWTSVWAGLEQLNKFQLENSISSLTQVISSSNNSISIF